MPIDINEAAFRFTLFSEGGIYASIGVGVDGIYELPTPSRAGYEFLGWYKGDDKFAQSGVVGESLTLTAKWQLIETTTFAQFYEYALGGADKIYIKNNFEISDTIYIIGDTTIIVDNDVTLKRSASFKGDMFVVGENDKGESSIILGHTPKITFAPKENVTITIDGNGASVEAEGTVFLLVNSATMNMNNGVVITNCQKLSNNRLLKNSYSFAYPDKVGGAAIIIASGSFNMYGGKILNCEVATSDAKLADNEEDFGVSSCGGAIYNYGSVNILDGEIRGCNAARGGAIYNYRDCRIEKASLTQNNASVYGGAIYLPGSQYSKIILGKDSEEVSVVFDSNTAQKSGGAMFGQMKNMITIYGGTKFVGNEALENNGGAINTSGSLVIKYANFDSNRAASKGGAIYGYYSNDSLTTRMIEIAGGIFTGNQASKGGALAFSASSDTFETGAKGFIGVVNFEGNSAFATETEDPELPDENADEVTAGSFNGNGGAIYISRKSQVQIDGATFSANEADRKGGSIYLTGSASLTVKNINMSESVSGDNGGGIYCYKATSLVVIDSVFTSNTSNSTQYGGGAIYFTGSIGTITNTDFTDNISAWNGGAICGYSNAEIRIDGGNFARNTSNTTETTGGGAIYLSESTMNIANATFSGNHTENYGGAISAQSKSVLSLTNCEFKENSTSKNGGALSVFSGANVGILSCNFAGNTASTRAGAIYISGSTVTVNGTAENKTYFTANTASGQASTDGGGAIYAVSEANVTLDNFVASANSAAKGGFLYMTSTGTKVTIKGGSSTGNTANGGGSDVWSNTTKCILNLTNYPDQAFKHDEGGIAGKDGKININGTSITL